MKRKITSSSVLPLLTKSNSNCYAPLCRAARRGEVRLCALARPGYPGRALPPDVLPGVAALGSWDATGPQSWGVDWHRHEAFEITYLSHGRLDFMVETGEFCMESGQLAFTLPGQPHRLGNPNVGASRVHWLVLAVRDGRPDLAWNWPEWLVLSHSDRRRLGTLLTQNSHPVWTANAEVAACFARMARLAETNRPAAGQTKLQHSINELLVLLLDLLEEQPPNRKGKPAARDAVERFLSALPQRLDRSWTLEEMARQCGLGVHAFTDHCRQVTNLSPAKFLARCRIQAAKTLLKSRPDYSITDVAFDCGFQSSQYLATAFRRLTGQTPREFRAS